MNKLNFIYLFPNLFLFCICMNLTACSEKNSSGDNLQSGDEIISFEPDLDTLIRNPASGWTLYDDANDYVAQANTYWNQQGAAAEKYASIFYWRSRWSELEPEEGKYAWEHDENFKALIQGALDRGLKLAFRVYIDGQDNIHNGTPDFVREAGAKGYAVHKLWDPANENNNWTPYADDPVFQEKFGNFIRAFAKEFDNPEQVDFIDAYNLGWWGEGHHVQYLNNNNKFKVYQWITDLYAKNFKKSQDNNGDEIEFIGNDRRTEARIKRRQRAEEAKNMPVNMQYRKAFRKAAIKSSKAARDSDGKSLENMQPQDITINRITNDADAADRITASYEKARYSDKNISKEELEFMLDFIKNDKYNKRT